jgi:hypothetical protein
VKVSLVVGSVPSSSIKSIQRPPAQLHPLEPVSKQWGVQVGLGSSYLYGIFERGFALAQIPFPGFMLIKLVIEVLEASDA